MKPILLGVNIDHIATLRQARGTLYPDPLEAAFIAEQAGADGITVHLREDRRHIQERDVLLLQEIVQTKVNLEMAATPQMIDFASKLRPKACCLVPEKREELTTEGGLDVLSNSALFKSACHALESVGIEVSFFIDPDPAQIDAAYACGARVIEIHTGAYAEAKSQLEQNKHLLQIISATRHAHHLGLQVNAGHGLNYFNVQSIAAIQEIVELNIGHAIIARAAIVGLKSAVKSMKKLMLAAR